MSTNQILASAHNDRAVALRLIINHIQKFDLSKEEIVGLLLEIADEAEAESAVCIVKDQL